MMDLKTRSTAKAGCSAKRMINSPTTLFCLQAAQSSPQLGAKPTLLLLAMSDCISYRPWLVQQDDFVIGRWEWEAFNTLTQV